ncbi:MAG: hypothetical protein M1348_03735 [Candidatus Parvarchaeota archaeon]|jgi:hypothetical protein|nr:hypothetical protein [Candidatus Parvarchaeota archaeon]
MVNRRLKQIVAIMIAVAFVGSIIFFIPQVPNSTPLSYEILTPNNLINSTSVFYSLSPARFSNINVSDLGGIAQTPVSSITASTNATNLLELTNFILSSANLSYVESGGRLICVTSKQFLRDLCNNATASWELFTITGTNSALPYTGYGSISPGNVSLSQIKLNSISSTTNFILIYYSGQTGSTNNSGSVPSFPG